MRKKNLSLRKKNKSHQGKSNLFYPFSILLFPAVNSYRRFLIHKVCESIKNEVNSELTTFSIGLEDKRRTVLCHKKQLLIDPKEAAKAVER